MSGSDTKVELYYNTTREIIEPDEYEHFMASQSSSGPAPGTVFLDCLRGSKGRTTIVNRATKEILYTITTSTSLLSLAGGKTTFVRGAESDAASYAELGATTVKMSEHPEEEPLQKMRNGKLLHSDGFLKVSDKITVHGVDYRFRLNPLQVDHAEVQLVPALFPDSAPIVSFRVDPSSRQRGGEIIISPSAISSGPKAVPSAILHDGKPTWLLDTALVAQAIFRLDLMQTPGSPPVDDGKGGAAVERAGELIFRMGW